MSETFWGGPAKDVEISGTVGGPGGVTLVEGSAFCISRAGGDISPGGTQGFYYRDTRFLSKWELLINGVSPQHLAYYARSPDQGGFLSMVVRGSEAPQILVERSRQLGMGMRERIILRNVGPEPTVCRLELFCDSDFADLFEVKEARIQKEGY